MIRTPLDPRMVVQSSCSSPEHIAPQRGLDNECRTMARTQDIGFGSEQLLPEGEEWHRSRSPSLPATGRPATRRIQTRVSPEMYPGHAQLFASHSEIHRELLSLVCCMSPLLAAASCHDRA